MELYDKPKGDEHVYIHDRVKVFCPIEMHPDDISNIVTHFKDNTPKGYEKRTLERILVIPEDNGEYWQAKPFYKFVPFERIRRITGYLVGTVDRWNDAKRAELNERVKHDAR